MNFFGLDFGFGQKIWIVSFSDLYTQYGTKNISNDRKLFKYSAAERDPGGGSACGGEQASLTIQNDFDRIQIRIFLSYLDPN